MEISDGFRLVDLIHEMIIRDAIDNSDIDVIGYDNHKVSTNDEQTIERKDEWSSRAEEIPLKQISTSQWMPEYT